MNDREDAIKMLNWLVENPGSTAYEISIGAGISDPYRAFSLLAALEVAGAVSRRTAKSKVKWTIMP